MKGLLIIPDITGFTNFVASTNIDLGVLITRELLDAILDANPLDLSVSEIEGDAILFYNMQKVIPLNLVFEGLQKIEQAFESKLMDLNTRFNLQAELSLKFIVHYGAMNVYDIHGFKKLYGQTVIEAHCLLKNGQGKTKYVLLTQDYLDAATTNLDEAQKAWAEGINGSSQLEGLRTIDYRFYQYAA